MSTITERSNDCLLLRGRRGIVRISRALSVKTIDVHVSNVLILSGLLGELPRLSGDWEVRRRASAIDMSEDDVSVPI